MQSALCDHSARRETWRNPLRMWTASSALGKKLVFMVRSIYFVYYSMDYIKGNAQCIIINVFSINIDNYSPYKCTYGFVPIAHYAS